MEFPTIQKAIEYGQNSGGIYDIFDTKNCRIIDWTEISEKIEDGWVYNEKDLMWVKVKEDNNED